jgi:hypothetical protein
MNTAKLRTIAAVAATLSVAMSAVASAAPTKSGSPTQAPTTSAQAAKVKAAGLWGTIDTGNLELDKFCEGEADFINQPAMQTPKGGNTMADLKGLNTDIANQANQKGCKLFPQ